MRVARAGRLVAWPAGVAVGLAAEWTAFGWDDPRRWVPDLVVGWVLIACGLVGWSRRPESRFGALATATGFCWFLGNFAGAENGALAWVAGRTIFLYRGPLFQLVIAYPSGRPSARLDRAAVIAGYAAAVGTAVWSSGLGTIALAALLVATSARSYARASGRPRRARLLALRAAVVLGVALAGGAVARFAAPSTATDELTLLALQAVICAVVVGLLVGLLSTARELAVVTDLVVELGGRRSIALSRELGRSLGDPTLTIGYWLSSRGMFVDSEGRSIELPNDPATSFTLVGTGDDPIAVIIHDSSRPRRSRARRSRLTRGGTSG